MYSSIDSLFLMMYTISLILTKNCSCLNILVAIMLTMRSGALTYITTLYKIENEGSHVRIRVQSSISGMSPKSNVRVLYLTVYILVWIYYVEIQLSYPTIALIARQIKYLTMYIHVRRVHSVKWQMYKCLKKIQSTKFNEQACEMFSNFVNFFKFLSLFQKND